MSPVRTTQRTGARQPANGRYESCPDKPNDSYFTPDHHDFQEADSGAEGSATHEADPTKQKCQAAQHSQAIASEGLPAKIREHVREEAAGCKKKQWPVWNFIAIKAGDPEDTKRKTVATVHPPKSHYSTEKLFDNVSQEPASEYSAGEGRSE